MRHLLAAALLAGLGTGAPTGAAAQPGAARIPADTLPFSHDEHRGVECGLCHQMDPDHGELRIRSISDCRSCHHAERASPSCATCHAPSDIRDELHPQVRTLTLSVGDPTTRDLPFRHAEHEEAECASCHEQGPDLSPVALDCGSCHAEHHAVDATCGACHIRPAADIHDVETVHMTCSGAGCHEAVPAEEAPRTRTGCLWCHREMSDHEPARECTVCHLLPAPRPGGEGGRR